MKHGAVEIDPIQACYAARAPEYEAVYEKPERQHDLARLRAWLPPWFAGARVLEVACGSGYWTRCIAERAHEVLAIDAAPQVPEIARDRVPSRHVALMLGDAYDLPADRGVFTAAFAGFWLSHVPRRRRREFFSGLGARLAPGAIVVPIDNLYVPGSSQPIAERDDNGDTWQRRTLRDGSVHRVLKNFLSDDELFDAVDGLARQPRVEHFGHHWALTYAALSPPQRRNP
jgi:SAM-dependent methyltransferase